MIKGQVNQNETSDISDFYKADIRRIAARLHGARARCGGRAKPGDWRIYHNIEFEFQSVMEGAAALYEKLGPMPPETSLDRINPRGPYSTENIRYATMAEQLANRKWKRHEQFCLTRNLETSVSPKLPASLPSSASRGEGSSAVRDEAEARVSLRREPKPEGEDASPLLDGVSPGRRKDPKGRESELPKRGEGTSDVEAAL